MPTVIVTRGNIERLDEEELNFRREALRKAVLFTAITKLISVICYSILLYAVYLHSKGNMSTILQVMVSVTILLTILYGSILLLAVLTRSSVAVIIGLLLCLIHGTFNTVLGIVGALYYANKLKQTANFLLFFCFCCLTASLCTMLCCDFKLIFAYRTILRLVPEETETSGRRPVIIQEVKS